MMMTGHELFCKAHKIARETRNSFVTYRSAFSAALKGVYAMMKETEKTTAEKLEALGIEAWERGDMKRYYINDDALEAVFGLRIGRYNTGNISSASLNGEPISNSRAYKLMGRKIFFDAVKGEWMQSTEYGTRALNDTLRESLRV